MAADADAGANADQVAYWNAAAGETWVAMQDRLDRQLAPLGRAAMDVLDIAADERLIDVGCGCGASCRSSRSCIATQVSPAAAFQ